MASLQLLKTSESRSIQSMSNPSSVFLARLLGPTALALAVTEVTNRHIFSKSNAATIYLNGAVLFVSGLSIVLRHNVWARRWSTFVTGVGWLTTALGFARMAWPEFMLEQAGSNTIAVGLIQMAVLILGLLLCWKGYFVATSHRV